MFLQSLRLDTPIAVQLAPRVTQALLSVVHDVVLLLFARTHLPQRLQFPTLLVSSLSWFNCFTHTRPFSNCVESTLHLAALTAWPKISFPATQPGSTACGQPQNRRLKRALAVLLAGLCCVVRPPAAVLFLPIAAFEVLHIPSTPSKPNPGILARVRHAAAYICDCVILAAVVVTTNGLLDQRFYGRWVLPAWVNLEFNVLQNSSADYGTHPAHWYFSQGLPAMLGSLLPLALWGIWATANRNRRCTGTMSTVPLWPLLLGVWGVAMHSFLPHKEFRYILPSFELILMYAAVPLASPLPSDSSAEAKKGGSGPEQSADAPASAGLRRRLAGATEPDELDSVSQRSDAGQQSVSDVRWRNVVCAVAIALQVPMLAYFGLVHQRGTVAVMEHLSRAQTPSVCSCLALRWPQTCSAVFSHPTTNSVTHPQLIIPLQ